MSKCKNCNDRGFNYEIGTWKRIECECIQTMKEIESMENKKPTAQDWIDVFKWCQDNRVTPDQIRKAFASQTTGIDVVQLEFELPFNPQKEENKNV